MKHLRYLRYLLAHKWWVAYAAVKMGLTPLEWPGLWWRLLVHDLSKFRPSEWLPYAESFYGPHEWKARPPGLKDAFNRAWLLHQQRNDHHWQSWCLLEDSGDFKILEMSANAEMEMLCDWAGAGRAIASTTCVKRPSRPGRKRTPSRSRRSTLAPSSPRGSQSKKLSKLRLRFRVNG